MAAAAVGGDARAAADFAGSGELTLRRLLSPTVTGRAGGVADDAGNTAALETEATTRAARAFTVLSAAGDDLPDAGTEFAAFAGATRAPGMRTAAAAAGRALGAGARPRPRSVLGDSVEARADELAVPESPAVSALASPAPHSMPALNPAANVPDTNNARNEIMTKTLLLTARLLRGPAMSRTDRDDRATTLHSGLQRHRIGPLRVTRLTRVADAHAEEMPDADPFEGSAAIPREQRQRPRIIDDVPSCAELIWSIADEAIKHLQAAAGQIG